MSIFLLLLFYDASNATKNDLLSDDVLSFIRIKLEELFPFLGLAYGSLFDPGNLFKILNPLISSVGTILFILLSLKNNIKNDFCL